MACVCTSQREKTDNELIRSTCGSACEKSRVKEQSCVELFMTIIDGEENKDELRRHRTIKYSDWELPK